MINKATQFYRVLDIWYLIVFLIGKDKDIENFTDFYKTREEKVLAHPGYEVSKKALAEFLENIKPKNLKQKSLTAMSR